MKQKTMILILSSMLVFTLSGCSWFDRTDKNANNNNTTINATGNDASKNDASKNDASGSDAGKTAKTLQDMMNSFEESGVTFGNVTPINDMEFAAHEGRMFDVNGERVYIYRMNLEDAQMNELMQKAMADKRVTVNRNGVDEEYNALVNNDYLLVYGSNASIAPLDELFTQYR